MEETNKTNTIQSFSLRRIPVTENKTSGDEFIDENKDKIKILELCNLMDNWEKELLFSENGFFSLKGKSAEGKTKEFIRELNEFINREISKIKFSRKISYEKISRIKEQKILSIKRQMEEYELKQLSDWEISVYEESLNSAIERAVLYKNKSSVVNSSYKNALEILKFMAYKENWDSKTLKSKKTAFESEFYISIINSFIKDRDISGSILYEKIKDKIKARDKEKIEKSLEKLKNIIISYNYANELFSYDLSDKENEKEIKKVNDSRKEVLIKEFLSDLKREKDINERDEYSRKNEQNWKELTEKAQSEKSGLIIYIDTFLNEKSQNAKRKYIEKIFKNGYVDTDKEVFLKLLQNVAYGFEKFKKEDISDFRADLSSEDFEIIENLRKQNDTEVSMFISDFNYVLKELKSLKITDTAEVYLFVKSVISAKNCYESTNKKHADFEVRNKIIKSVLERYQKQNREEKNDGIINNSGK